MRRAKQIGAVLAWGYLAYAVFRQAEVGDVWAVAYIAVVTVVTLAIAGLLIRSHRKPSPDVRPVTVP